MLLYSLLHLTRVKAVDPDYETLGEPSVSLDDIKTLSPARLEGRRASRVPPDLRRRDDDRAARPGGRDVGRHGDRRPVAENAHFTGRDADVRLRRLRGLRRRRPDGGRLGGGGVDRRAPSARQPLLDLRQQPHLDRRRHGRSPTAMTSPPAFMGYGWNVTRVGDANDLGLLDARLRPVPPGGAAADADHRRQPHRLGLAHKQDTAAAHGEPLGEDEVRATKRTYGWPEDAEFLVPDGVLRALRRGLRGARAPAALRSGRSCWSATSASTSAWRADRPDAAPRAARWRGTPRSRASRPTRRGWRRARRAKPGAERDRGAGAVAGQRVGGPDGLGLERPRLREAGTFSRRRTAPAATCTTASASTSRPRSPTGFRCASCGRSGPPTWSSPTTRGRRSGSRR